MNNFGILLNQNKINQNNFRNLELEFLNNPTKENSEKAENYLNNTLKPYREQLFQVGKELILKRMEEKKLPQSTIKTNVNRFVSNIAEIKNFKVCDHVFYLDLPILLNNCKDSKEFIECIYTLRDLVIKEDEKNRFVSLDTKEDIDTQVEYFGKDDSDSIYLLENFKPLYNNIMYSIGEKFWVK